MLVEVSWETSMRSSDPAGREVDGPAEGSSGVGEGDLDLDLAEFMAWWIISTCLSIQYN